MHTELGQVWLTTEKKWQTLWLRSNKDYQTLSWNSKAFFSVFTLDIVSLSICKSVSNFLITSSLHYTGITDEVRKVFCSLLHWHYACSRYGSMVIVHMVKSNIVGLERNIKIFQSFITSLDIIKILLWFSSNIGKQVWDFVVFELLATKNQIKHNWRHVSNDDNNYPLSSSAICFMCPHLTVLGKWCGNLVNLKCA